MTLLLSQFSNEVNGRFDYTQIIQNKTRIKVDQSSTDGVAEYFVVTRFLSRKLQILRNWGLTNAREVGNSFLRGTGKFAIRIGRSLNFRDVTSRCSVVAIVMRQNATAYV